MGNSTLEDVREGPPRRGEWLRRISLALLILAIVLGAAGLLGDRDSTVTATEDDYTLNLEYPRTSRAGLDAPWRLSITRPSGFEQDVVVRVSSEYLSLFQFHGMHPLPAQESSDGSFNYWTFPAPPGQELVIELDHTVKPSAWLGSSGTVAVMVGGEPVAPLEFTTTLFP